VCAAGHELAGRKRSGVARWPHNVGSRFLSVAPYAAGIEQARRRLGVDRSTVTPVDSLTAQKSGSCKLAWASHCFLKAVLPTSSARGHATASPSAKAGPPTPSLPRRDAEVLTNRGKLAANSSLTAFERCYQVLPRAQKKGCKRWRTLPVCGVKPLQRWQNSEAAANACERRYRLDKLGVTGSSPVPPIQKRPATRAFLFSVLASLNRPVPGRATALG
jgi:hypothetical protein